MKNQLNVKLGARTIELIKALAAQRGESQANVITIAIDRMAREELPHDETPSESQPSEHVR